MAHAKLTAARPEIRASGQVVNPWPIDVGHPFDLDAGPSAALILGDAQDWTVRLQRQSNVIADGVHARATRFWSGELWHAPAGLLRHVGAYEDVRARFNLNDESAVVLVEFGKRPPKP